MRKEMRVTVIFTVLAVLFFLAVEYRDLIFGDPARSKTYVLAAVLLLVQTKVFGGMEENFLASDSRLIQAKRDFLKLYAEARDCFHEVYRLVTIQFRYNAVVKLLAQLGFNGSIDEKINDKVTRYDMGKRWLEGTERIPYNELPKKMSMLEKIKISDRIGAFRRKVEAREDIFYACLSGRLMGVGKSQSIVELILVWVSYFYFLTDIFKINLGNYSDMIILLLVMTILDMGRHYLAYQKKVENIRTVYCELWMRMMETHCLMQKEDCAKILMEGEQIPCSNRVGSMEEAV